MVIRSAELETVCGVTSKLPKNMQPEVAFCGRSNVGKSSLINSLLKRRALARTSEKPGKTQTLNFYHVNNALYLVDLPGYGYAKSSKKDREAWGRMIERYLMGSDMLCAVFMLVDSRHAPTALDKQMFEWLRYLDMETVILATKIDKLKKREVALSEERIRETLGTTEDTIVVPYSSKTHEGRDIVLDLLLQVLENEASA